MADGMWHIECEPHVAIRLKRVFGKVSERDYGTIYLSASEENSRDLEWFLQRYPMEVVGADELHGRARAYDARAARVVEILSGEYDRPSGPMALPPREYQARAAALALNNRGLLLADELGLGKTVSALTVLSNGETLPALVAVPAHLPEQWAAEVRRFLPHLEPHVIQKLDPYPLAGIDGAEPDVMIASYHKLRGWAEELAGKVRTVIFDECQELRRRDSQKYQAAKHLAHKAQLRVGLSATPIYNYGEEFWAVMNCIAPGALGNHAEFIREWCIDEYRGKARIQNPKAFGTYLREQGRMLRRTRRDVARELPALSRLVQEISCDTEPLQEDAAAAELARIILGQGGGFEKMQAAGEFDMRMRQATGIGKAPYVAEFVRMLLEEDAEPVVLFGWHRAVYDLWADRLSEFEPAWYTGTESPAKKQRELQRFLYGDTPLLIMSLRSGSGVDGIQDRCSRVVIGELDWSPGVLEQCIGRIHRDGQRDPVFVYYLTAADGADPVMVDVLGLKKAQIDGVREPFGGVTELQQIDPGHVKRLAEAYLARSSS